MVTDDIIRKRFIHDVLSQHINLIYEIQEQTVRTYLNRRSGQLLTHLSTRPFSSISSETKETFYMRIFPYLRFLDIHYRRGEDRISRHIRSHLALYNRVVWGVLYHEAFPKIQYGMTEDIRRNLRQELEAALKYEESHKD